MSVRSEFPILQRTVNGKPLVYLDNGATVQKPQRVIDAIGKYYAHGNSNIHRGVHALSQEATMAYEAARETVRSFINAALPSEVIFTSGTTDGINLVAQCLGDMLQPGDEILLSGMEHHSNIVPWHMLRDRKGVVLKFIPVTDAGELDMVAFRELLTERTKLFSITYVSNTLGTVNPVRDLIREAKKHGTKVLVDSAQAVHHIPIDVQDLDCDFMAFSGHKMYGPTGIGVLYGKQALLEVMPPYRGGGDMIKTVTLERTEYNEPPLKFEAGTPHISGAICLAEAIRFIQQTGWEAIQKHEAALLTKAVDVLSSIDGVRLVGTPKHRSGVVSFMIDGVHPYDAGVILDKLGIAVRTGHHCTQPLMDRFGIPGTIRASFAVYNTLDEIDRLAEGVRKVKQMMA